MWTRIPLSIVGDADGCLWHKEIGRISRNERGIKASGAANSGFISMLKTIDTDYMTIQSLYNPICSLMTFFHRG